MDSKKKFDAVAQSRQWRMSSGAKLASMTRSERLSHLNENIEGKLKALSETRKSPVKRPRKSNKSMLIG